MRSPLVSFLIPAYNAALHIEETLRSVLVDPRDDVEVIVVDDGSTDGTSAILHSLGDDRVRVVSQSNKGLPATRNTGLQYSHGKYVVFLDGDDVFNMSALDALVRPLEADPGVSLSYGEYRRFIDRLPTSRAFRVPFPIRPSGALLETIVQRNFIGALGACCVRRASLDETGPFNAELRMGEDWEMYVRLAGVGKFQHVAGITALFYRQHALSMSAVLGGSAANYAPFSAAVFGNEKVIEGFSGRRIERLRRSQQAHIHAYIASRAAEAKAWRKSARELVTAVATYPPRSLEFIARLGWNVLRGALPERPIDHRN